MKSKSKSNLQQLKFGDEEEVQQQRRGSPVQQPSPSPADRGGAHTHRVQPATVSHHKRETRGDVEFETSCSLQLQATDLDTKHVHWKGGDERGCVRDSSLGSTSPVR